MSSTFSYKVDGGTTSTAKSLSMQQNVCKPAVAETVESCGVRLYVMADFGKVLVFLGVILAVAGMAMGLLGRTGLPLGRLPGGIFYRGKNTTFYFPLATSLLLSVVLSFVLYVIGRFRR